jgi:adenylate cyclase
VDATFANLRNEVLVLAVSAWWLWPATKPSPTPPVATATAIAQPLVAPWMSIVILPFTNLGGDPEQQYFVDGITDDLTTDLSQMSDSFVISRNTAFTYKNKPVVAKQTRCRRTCRSPTVEQR